MSEQKMSSIVHGIHEAIVGKDIQKLLSFFTENATVISSEGTFKGKKEIERYFSWLIDPFEEAASITVNLIIHGKKAAHEYVVEGTSADGTRVSMPAVALYDFKDDKAHEIRIYLDRLIQAKQMAKGWFPKRIVNTIVSQMEKGL